MKRITILASISALMLLIQACSKAPDISPTVGAEHKKPTDGKTNAAGSSSVSASGSLATTADETNQATFAGIPFTSSVAQVKKLAFFCKEDAGKVECYRFDRNETLFGAPVKEMNVTFDEKRSITLIRAELGGAVTQNAQSVEALVEYASRLGKIYSSLPEWTESSDIGLTKVWKGADGSHIVLRAYHRVPSASLTALSPQFRSLYNRKSKNEEDTKKTK